MTDLFISDSIRNKPYLISIVLLVIAAFFLRPMALGEAFTSLALIFSFIAFISFIVSEHKIEKTKTYSRNQSISGCTILIWIYLVIHALISGAKNPQYLFSALVTFSFVICVYSSILSDNRSNKYFFTALRVTIILFILSYFTTLLLSLFVPLDKLHLFDIRTSSIVDYSNKWGGVYFPLTPAYGITKVFGLTFFRSPGPFREAGIFQAFIIWVYYTIHSSGRTSFLLKTILILGLVASYSTAGIVIFGLTALVNILFNMDSSLTWQIILKKVFTMLIVFGSILIIFLYMPIFGLIDKMGKSQASIMDRIDATRNGLSLLYDNPFGVGYFNSHDPSIGVNFISASGLIGFPGIVLFALLIAVAVFPLNSAKESKAYIVWMFPFILTGLFSQPFIDAPLIYIMLFQRTAGEI